MEPPPPTFTALTVLSSPLQSHAVRIPPNADLVPSLLQAAKQAMANSNAKSAFVLTAVGSLSEVTLRMAATDNKDHQSEASNKKQKTTDASSLATQSSLRVRTFSKHFEIVSLVGTFSSDGGKHLHMSVSNDEGQVLGGHLMAGTVYTTLELVLGTMSDVAFTREMDARTGYQELNINNSGITPQQQQQQQQPEPSKKEPSDN